MSGVVKERESQQILSALGRVLRRRRLIIAACLFGTLAPIVYYNQVTPPLYEASTSLVFEEASNLVPSEAATRTSPAQYLVNRLQEINSLVFAQDIAKALPKSLKARFPVPKEISGDSARAQRIGEIIHKSISAYPLGSSIIARIRVQMSDPVLCMAVANLSLDVLQKREHNIHLRGVTDLLKYIEEQLARVNTQLKESESNLKEFKEKNKITSLDTESNEILRKMTEAEVQYNTTRASRGAQQEKLATVQKVLAEQRRDLVPAVTNVASPSAQNLKTKLVDLQAQYAQLIVQAYPENHPELLRLQQEIDQTKKALAEEAIKITKGGMIGDPIAQLQRYVDQSVTLQIDVESLKAQERALSQTVVGYRRFLGRLPAKEYELARLVRERDVNQKLYTTLRERREEARISEAKQIPNSRVIDRAEFPQRPLKPRKMLNLAVGTALGLILGMGLGLVIESRGNKLESVLGFEQDSGWPVLAMIPEMKTGPAWTQSIRRRAQQRGSPGAEINAGLVSHLDPQSAAGESYLMLRTRLELLGLGMKHRSMLVTSCAPGDGKSSTLSNLAAAFGAAGRSTLVVDAELRRPVQHDIFGVRRTPGLSDLLLARNGGRSEHLIEEEVESLQAVTADGEVAENGIFQPTTVEGVTLLASGNRTPWREMSLTGLRSLLDDLAKTYDVVLVDSAPPLLVHDTLILCGLVDAVLFVVDSCSYDMDRLMETKRLLMATDADVVGAVVNRVDPGGRYGYYYSYYGPRA